MKKLLLIIILTLSLNVYAYGKEDLKDKLFAKYYINGEEYSLDAKQQEIVEDYLNNENFTDDEVNTLYQKLEEIINLLKTQDNLLVSNYPKETKDSLKRIIQDITALTHVKVNINKERIIIYRSDGTEIIIDSPVKQTGFGNDLETKIVAISFLILLLGLIYLIGKMIRNVTKTKKCYS